MLPICGQFKSRIKDKWLKIFQDNKLNFKTRGR